MFTLKSVSTHVSMDVADLEESTEYLEEVLRLPKDREVTVEGLGRIVFYPGLELMQVEPGGTPGVVKHVAWEVDDIYEAIEYLKDQVAFETDGPLEAPFKDTCELVLYINFTTPVGLAGEIIQVKELEV
jgi:catechol 2,3-dioxygenase-like lactoylglutathione lyase family enzyme